MSISDHNERPEYFGPASNYSFVNQLNHLLRQSDDSHTTQGIGLERFGMKPTVLDQTSGADFFLENISEDVMKRLVEAYLETWAIPCPIFEAHQLYQLAQDTWKNPNSSANDKALLFLTLSVGASTSYFDIEESSPDAFPIARGFFNLALHTVPSIFSQVSFEAVRILFLMGLSVCCLGDTALSYIYLGMAVRVLLAIGLHKDVMVTKTAHSFDTRHHKRVWVRVWQFEKYWSFCVGRPSGSSEHVTIPTVSPEVFEYKGYGESEAYKQTSEHMRIRVQFASLLSKIHAELYNSKNDLLTILNKVEHFSIEIDETYFNSNDKDIVKAEVEDDVSLLKIERVREWFWIRIYYLYTKLIIFRPFLAFDSYMKNTATDVSNSIREKIKVGSDTCVDVALELSNFIIRLNNKVRMLQPILFVSTYLESASTVLLFYIVSSLSLIPDSLARSIWNVLQDTRNFLNGSYGSYLGSTKIMARDGLESLRDLLKRRKDAKTTTYLDKIIRPVTIGSPAIELNLTATQDLDSGLEAFWLQTLDWINYR